MTGAEIIRRARTSAKLSQRQLAARAGTSGPAVSLYENGERIPRVDTLQRIVAAAGATLTIAVDLGGEQTIDVRRNACTLDDLLDLADRLPRASTPDLEYPILRDEAR